MVNFFRAAAAGLLAFASVARAAPAVANQFADGYKGSIEVRSTSPLTIRYSTSQPDDRNWIGIYAAVNGGGPDDQKLGSKPSLKWAYAKGLDGIITVPTDGLPAGDYKAYFLAREGYIWQAAPVQFSLGKTFAGSLKVTGGYPIRVQYNTTQRDPHNWVGIYFAGGGGPDSGEVADQAIRWAFAGESQGSLEIPVDGFGDGLYKAFLLPASGYKALAAPQIFAQGNAVFKGALAVDYSLDTFSFRYATQRPGDKNWIGVWRYGEGPDSQSGVAQALTWGYATQALGMKKVDGRALPAGRYQAFLLANDGHGWLASPITIHK